MITRVGLENFKAFTDITLDISPLTLLTGKNGMGKSSFIQSLLLLRQSYHENKTLSTLSLKGNLVNIGYGKDLLNVHASDEIISFTIRFDKNTEQSLSYTSLADSDTLALSDGEVAPFLFDQPLFSNSFQYLKADRIVPVPTFEASPHAIDVLKTVGEKGQYTIHFLDKYKFNAIHCSSLQHPKALSETLLDNVDAWLSEISSEVRVKPQYHPDLKLSTLKFEFPDEENLGQEFSSLNTGFGLTYVLPVIVAVLSARKGDLLIIENPESHLHPQGQAVLGRLLAMASAAGVQVIVESHSDHLFNGIRVAIKEKILSVNDFSVYFFSRNVGDSSIETEQPLVDEKGRLSYQPADFFDEYAKQLTQIIQNK